MLRIAISRKELENLFNFKQGIAVTFIFSLVAQARG
jgi:hypothetical protein